MGFIATAEVEQLSPRTPNLDALAELAPKLVVLFTSRFVGENATFPSVFTFMYTPDI